MEVKTITVEGVLLYSDGKPVADVSVSFKAVRKQSTGKDDDEENTNDAGARTDSKGRFSIKIVQGVSGFLSGSSYYYIGEFENCPKLDRLIKEAGSSNSRIETSPIEIKATANLYGVELKFPFPSCKKAKTP